MNAYDSVVGNGDTEFHVRGSRIRLARQIGIFAVGMDNASVVKGVAKPRFFEDYGSRDGDTLKRMPKR